MKSYLLYLGIIGLLSSGSVNAWNDPACSKEEQEKWIKQIANKKSCDVIKSPFKSLYLCLQRQVDYDGNISAKLGDFKSQNNIKIDCIIANATEQLTVNDCNKKNGVSISPGKKIETALQEAYQTSLKKVALLYEKSLSNSETFKDNTQLMQFFNQIDPANTNKKTDEVFISTNYKSKKDGGNDDMKKLLDSLQAQSKEQFPNKPTLQLSNEEIYFLQNLLTHAQDRVGTTKSFDTKGTAKIKGDHEKIRIAPLNRMIQALRNSGVSKNTAIIKDPLNELEQKQIINEAVQMNMQNLRVLYNKHKNCLKDSSFIQKGIQKVNYGLFLQALTCPAKIDSPMDTKNIEALLHFINANKKFHKEGSKDKSTLQAETDMKPIELEAKIDLTFTQIFSCEINTDGKIAVRNIPTDKKTILCKDNKGDTITNCDNAFDKVTSDKYGKGLIIDSNKIKSIEVDGISCGLPAVTPSSPVTDPVCKETEELKEHKCIAKATDPVCKETEELKEHKCIAKATDPVCKETEELKEHKCVAKAADTGTVDSEKKKCEAQNPETDGTEAPGAKKQYTWNEKTKKCDNAKKEESSASPDSPAAEPTEREKATGMPVRPPDIQMPPRPSMGVLRGLQ